MAECFPEVSQVALVGLEELLLLLLQQAIDLSLEVLCKTVEFMHENIDFCLGVCLDGLLRFESCGATALVLEGR